MLLSRGKSTYPGGSDFVIHLSTRKPDRRVTDLARASPKARQPSSIFPAPLELRDRHCTRKRQPLAPEEADRVVGPDHRIEGGKRSTGGKHHRFNIIATNSLPEPARQRRRDWGEMKRVRGADHAGRLASIGALYYVRLIYPPRMSCLNQVQ